MKPESQVNITYRVEVRNLPGMLGRLATAIGETGANITALQMAFSSADTVTQDITIEVEDDAQEARLRDVIDRLPGVRLTWAADRILLAHRGGKLEIRSRIPVASRDDLSIAYTPGVAQVCRVIAAEPAEVWNFTIRRNTVAIVTDGTAVLGLGDIGPRAALPVMEGKAILFKEFADVDAFPICLGTTDVERIIDTVAYLAPTFGGVNLEDISAPRCFEIEERLRQRLDIPVFHDDQHGTAVVVLAALLNALKLVDKKMDELKVAISGVGAAGVAIAKMLMQAGVANVIGVDSKGAVFDGRTDLNPTKRWLAEHTNPDRREGSLREVLPGADVFIGVSQPDILDRADVAGMGTDPIVFALSNPDPEIRPEQVDGVVAVYATGRSDYPNQVNNVLAFPGIFRGALDAGATSISEGMKLAAAEAIAASVPEERLRPDFIIPSSLDREVPKRVAEAVRRVAIEEGHVRDPGVGFLGG